MNCNLSLWLPEREKTAEQEKYLAERSGDHERLAKGIFHNSEEKCRRYHKFVLKRCAGNTFIEEKLRVYMGATPFEGTPDLFGFDEENKTLYIVDYKTGFHNVTAWGNSQLFSYAVLIMLTKKEWDIEHFKLSILNTQSDLCSHFEPLKEKVLMHVARIRQSLKFITEGTAYAVTGEWCRFCPSKEYCPLQRDIQQTKDLVDADVDKLIYAKETRAGEIKRRMKEFKDRLEPSKVFSYELVGPQKKLKVIKTS